jgi:excisionase family DNA binding protein
MPSHEDQIASPLRLLDLKLVAEMFSMSVSTLRREIRLRRLPVHRIGRAIRVSEADLQAYLGKRRRNAR